MLLILLMSPVRDLLYQSLNSFPSNCRPFSSVLQPILGNEMDERMDIVVIVFRTFSQECVCRKRTDSFILLNIRRFGRQNGSGNVLRGDTGKKGEIVGRTVVLLLNMLE